VKVTVVFAVTGDSAQDVLELPPGSRLQDALVASSVAAQAIKAHGPLATGIWNHARALDTPLKEGDRIELYKPLIADPKDARRARAARSRQEAQKKKAAARKVTAA
jgi:putative ubiquitin-RnfH superfamily antitoxin RatB of RatAB toxin-antitoxin module